VKGWRRNKGCEPCGVLLARRNTGAAKCGGEINVKSKLKA